MGRGIALVGLNGSGKSTLGHALAKELGYFEIDVDDEEDCRNIWLNVA